MSNNSDHTQPQLDITQYVPDVYQSEVSTTVFDVAFNRHLTKDDTQLVSGLIGQPNPLALINRQIIEPTPHRQAYQLAPTMYTQIGTVQTALSFKALEALLKLDGVDMNRYPQWGNTLQFNWVPPVNIDMLVNYQNYYWAPVVAGAPPQYLTIENRCKKAQSRVTAYQQILTQYGSTFTVTIVDFANNAFQVATKLDVLFVAGFVFSTQGNVSLQNKFFTVSSSTFDILTTTTTIYVVEPISIRSSTAPLSPMVNDWWYNTTTHVLSTWNGVIWQLTSTSQAATISIAELLQVYQAAADCYCNKTSGWDVAPWDDNQIGTVLWNTALLLAISSPTAPLTPALYDLWYDTTSDVLNQWNGSVWVTVVSNFSVVLSQTTGTNPWDLTSTGSCTPQIQNQWTLQNQWIHKSEVQSFAGVKNAQLPILEYNSNLELNAWARDTYAWKYRSNTSAVFAATSFVPTRFELEPIKGFVVDATNRYIYLFDKTQSIDRDIDYTSTFVPGFQFREADDGIVSAVYTVMSSEYREITTIEAGLYPDLALNPIYNAGYMVTVVHIDETYVAPVLPTNLRLEPIRTSRGDLWGGYHAHWVLDTTSLTTVPAAPQSWDIARRRSLSSTITPVLVPDGILYVGETHQELTVSIAGVTTIMLDLSLQFFNSVVPFTGSISATTLTISAIASDNITTGQVVSGVGVISGTIILSQVLPLLGGESLGGVGRYLVSMSQTIGSEAMNALLPSTSYAVAGGTDLRVYVNDIRQYGNYTELTALGLPNFTVVGFISTITPIQISYVTGIQFDTPLNIFDVVRIEVGSAAFSDMGMVAVPIRTIEDDLTFASAVVAGTQPVYDSLTQYKQVEQVKTSVNQYPLFNIYDVVTGDIIKASPVFSFSEDSSYPINIILQRRIVASADGKEYQFTQDLLDSDDHLLYGYRNVVSLTVDDTFIPSKWWYNPNTGLLQGWDGEAWTSNIELVSPTTGGMVVRRPTYNTEAPTATPDYELSLWYDITNNALYIWTFSFPVGWSQYNAEVIVGADPTLQTIWKPGLNDEQFVPQYVDGNRVPITVGSPEGDWQLPDQWTFNPEHRNKSIVLLSELTTHFNSILTNQPPSPGLQSGGVFALTQDQFNYGLGGTIKEHNDSFDTLISAFNVSNTNPLGVLDFAQQEYASSLLTLQDIYNKSIVQLLTQYTQDSIANLSSYVANSVITTYEENQVNAETYIDSSAYNVSTGQGVKNWIATAPMFGFSEKYVPHLNVGSTFVELYCHDGHRVQITLTSAVADRFARSLVSTPDARGALGTLGVISTSPYPTTIGSFSTIFGTDPVAGLLPGVFWYRTGGGPPVLYRLAAYAVTNLPPSFYLNGVELPDGTMYYNTISAAVYSKLGVSWSQITVTGAGNITPLWTVINFQTLLADTCLEVETRLYDVTPANTPSQLGYQMAGIYVQSSPPTVTNVGSYWYNPTVNTLTPNALSMWNGTTWQAVSLGTMSPLVLAVSAAHQAAEQLVYDQYNFDRFNAFVVERKITAPLINTTYSVTDPFMWNYVTSNVTTPPKTGTPPANASAWQEIYTRWYGTPYPHLEPWALQGFTDKPTWWDANYRDLTNARTWIPQMWIDIIGGLTPHGSPPTPAPTYSYVSVNIGATTTVDGYAPDQLLPPYYASTLLQQSQNISSLYTNYNQIVAPAADYAFGDVGPVEWMWTVSGQHVYDDLHIAFRMQPVRFMHYAFGPQYVIVNGLQVETTFENVYSHQETLFHGDLYNTNQVYTIRGLNQWYVNYNRYAGFDTNTQFRQQWSDWTPELTYQIGGITDPGTFDVSNKTFDISNQDYNIILVNTGVINDIWADGFNVSILSMPPALSQYNNQGKWKLELASLATIPRTLTCYGTKSYSCIPNTSTGVFNVLRYGIVSASSFFQRIVISGDQTDKFKQGTMFNVTSLANNGMFTVQGVVYQSSTDSTLLSVLEPVFDATVGGYLDLQGTIVSWNTGDRVVVTSTQLLPAPLLANTAYYVIKVGDNAYQLAETQADAFALLPITIASVGTGLLNIAEVLSTFVVFGGTGATTDVWYHFALDTTDVLTISPPYSFMSMQTLINIIDGYSAYQQTQGISYGVSDAGDFDPDTGRLVDWQLELERTINWAYSLRNSRVNISDRYGATVAVSTNNLTFTDMAPQWSTGTIVVVNSTGTLPAPLLPNTPYYYQQTTTPQVFQLSVTSIVLDPSDIVTFTSSGAGSLSVSLYNSTNVFPSFEMNPTRNSVWINTPQGILANIIEGPYTDIRVQQTIFDQYGRPLEADKLTVYREDKRSHISMRPTVVNDVDILDQNDPYNYIHFGGGHFFIEGFEHFVLFNDTTVNGNLIYNPFLGLYATRFDVDYYEKKDYSLRPTLGGYYLYSGQFGRNIEGSAADLKDLYNLQAVSELSATTQHTRALIGYTGASTFLDLININLQSQFLFYRGMIKSKGSVNSITAYINSRRFIDAQVDECWAWKVAEFGDVRPRYYPEIKLFTTDGLIDDVRLEFLAVSDYPTDPEFVADEAQGFQLVSFSDGTRWFNFPEQKSEIVSPLFLDADVTSLTVIYSGASAPTALQVTQGGLQYWFDSVHNHAYVWNETTLAWDSVTGKIYTSGGNVYFKHDMICDTTRVYRHTLTSHPVTTSTDFTEYSTDVFIEGTGTDQYDRVNAEVVRIDVSSFTDIVIIFTINPAKAKISPAQLLDTQSHVIVQTIPLWHPALGYHYPIAEHNITLQSNTDPALYQVSLSNPSTNAWDDTKIGTVWLDTNRLGYLPYYDDQIYPNVNDRLYNWGALAPWASVNAYIWTQSTVPPSEWDAAVLSDATNSTILQNNKATGTPRLTIFNRTRTPIPHAIPLPGTGGTAKIQISSLLVANGDSVLFVSAPTLNAIIPAVYGTDLATAISSALSVSHTLDLSVVGQATIAFGAVGTVGVDTRLLIAPGLYTFELNVNGQGSSVTAIVSVGGGSYTDGIYTDVSLTGGHGIGAKATITVSGHVVTSASITAGGVGYILGDILSADNGDIGGGGIATFGALVGGSQYTDNTYSNIPLTGGHGIGATSTITISGGIVTSVLLSLVGTGYQVGDVLSAASVNIGNGVATLGSPAGGSLYTPSSGTHTYTSVPLTGGTGSGATANLTVTNGSVISVVPVVGGIGYTVGDVLSVNNAIIGDGISSFTLVGGVHYTDGTYLSMPLLSGTGTGATGNITVTSGSVTAVVLTAIGVGYTVGDSLVASLSSGIATFGTLVGGSLYTTGVHNSVPLTGGSGSTATANITVDGSGHVSLVTLVSGGVGYHVGDVLSASTALIGDGIATLGSFVPGTGGSDAVYNDVALTHITGTGTGAKADITVSSGSVTAVVLTSTIGIGYAPGDQLTASLLGVPLGFSVLVATVKSSSGFTVQVATTAGSGFALNVTAVQGSGFTVPVATVKGSGFSIPVATVVGSGFSMSVTQLNTVYYVTATGVDTMASMAALMSTAAGIPVSVIGNAFVITTGTTGILPTGLLPSTKYTVTNVLGSGPYTFQVQDQATLQIVDILDTGEGTLTVVPAFKSIDWKKQPLIREKLYNILDIPTPYLGTLTLHSALWKDKDLADVYQNGVLVISSIPVSVVGPVITLPVSLTLQEKDIIDVIRPLHTLTSAESSFDPDTSDDGTVDIQWKQDYEYTITTTTLGSIQTGTTAVQHYYFWVEQSTNINPFDPYSLSISAVAQQLQTIPTPYFVVQKPKDDPTLSEEFGYGLIEYGSTWAAGTTAEQFFIVPVLYRQAVLRNSASYITDDNRYTIRFIRDWSLRDNIQANGKNMNLKDIHEEWQLIRKNQPNTISIVLWNKLIESLIGYTLVDPTIRVPSLERQLYDEINGTDTQYGLGVGQTFVNGAMALATIITYLEDPTVNFAPIDMDAFFSAYNFNTPAAIQAAMTEIYNTFPPENVNAIWFNALLDAFTTKAKYKELMKTSWVSLHGIRVLDVGGGFDD